MIDYTLNTQQCSNLPFMATDINLECIIKMRESPHDLYKRRVFEVFNHRSDVQRFVLYLLLH